ncbi:lytic transglycosylase domain-containing protein [Aquibium carbonis]|uniref:Lytic transglycosylase domain-containing protein n=1 Tax=Aquibium carbonis TaxID=2495581 RepID=A0A3R9YA98_9HYPH|nr:lytic transglycosylase domain-containing protein [Aquibium carbonis]
MTLAPVQAPPQAADVPEEPSADPAPEATLASVATDAARVVSDAARAATDAVKSAADAPEAVAEAPAEAEGETAATAFVAIKPSKPAAEIALAPSGDQPSDQRAKLDRLISHYADVYDVPQDLVHRVVRRESNYRPTAHSRGNWGLMQIRHATAKGMGYEGEPEGLLDAETNLRFAVRYLRGAYMVAGGDKDHAIRLYQRGYYYDAKRAGLLTETGLGRDTVRKRRPG